MIHIVDEKLREKMTKDGSHLKQTRAIGGAGAGMIAAGICFAGIGVLFAIMMGMANMLSGGLMLGGICIAIGAILGIPGYYLKKKRVGSCMAYYTKKSGYTEAALKEFDAEFQNGEVILISNKKKLDKRGIIEAGVLTKHWCKFPFMMPMSYSAIYHVDDIVAMWYQDTYVQIEGVDIMGALVMLDCHGKLTGQPCNKAMTQDLIEQIAKRNPKIITTRKFVYENMNYDVISQSKEVVALYKAIS